MFGGVFTSNEPAKIILVLGIIVLFICMSFTPSVAIDTIEQSSMSNSNGKTLYVGGSGLGNYTTIQEAIDDANPGDTVFVYDEGSPYFENVVVDKSINLIGENRNTTVINGIESIPPVVGFSYLTSNVLVSGFTITDSYPPSYMKGCTGVSMGGSNNTIKNNKIIFNRKGIEISDESNNNVITDNIIVHNYKVGVEDDCFNSYNTVKWNVISGNGDPFYYEYGGLYKHHSGGYYHHNDFDLNGGYDAYTSGSTWGVWDDGSEGNYWEHWESNPGYPDVYLIYGSFEDQIDYHPSATPYFDYPIVRIQEYLNEDDPGETIHFYSHVNKPVSSLSFLWDFGDGTTSNTKDPDHSYLKSGIYHINVTVTDDKGVSDTDRSIAYIGLLPDKPTITGPTKGKIGTRYKYSINTTDPDSDYLHYSIWWGDGREDYIGPYPSGEVVVISYVWSSSYYYTISVKAIDETFRESEWAYLNVQIIPRNRMSVNSLFLWFLERFPLLERLLGLIRVM
jgi:parallel beta-helix repeat protein